MPCEIASKKELEIIGNACYDYLKTVYDYTPVLVLSGIAISPVCSFIDIIDGIKKFESIEGVINGVRYGIQDIRPALDRLVSKGKIQYWFEVRSNGTSIQRFMYKPTDDELNRHFQVINELLASNNKKNNRYKRRNVDGDLLKSVNDLALLVGGST